MYQIQEKCTKHRKRKTKFLGLNGHSVCLNNRKYVCSLAFESHLLE
jgi:hypothetical protein